MGCGKSSVGRKLSELLCCPFMDLDEVIEERAGRTIPEIFSQDGEPAFRQIELDALKHVVSEGWSKTKSIPLVGSLQQSTGLIANRSRLPFTMLRAAMDFDSPITDQQHPLQLVLALGGGAVMTPECAEIVRSESKCIYLRGSIDTLMEHLEGQTENRPLLQDKTVPIDCHSDRAKRVEESALRGRITELMAKRSATYEKTAHIIIDIDGKSIETLASEITSILFSADIR